MWILFNTDHLIMILINYYGKSYILEPLYDEPVHEAYERLWKIIQHQPKTDYEWEQIIRVSKCWFYKQKFQCGYSDHIEDLIQRFDLNPRAQPDSKIISLKSYHKPHYSGSKSLSTKISTSKFPTPKPKTNQNLKKPQANINLSSIIKNISTKLNKVSPIRKT